MDLKNFVDFKDYVVKTYAKNGNVFYILEKTYYSKKEGKYVSAGSVFIDKQFASALVEVLGLRLFDNAKVMSN